MPLYLKTKKLDFATGDPLVVVIHSDDAKTYGINNGEKVELSSKELECFPIVNISDTEVVSGEIGLYYDIWSKYRVGNSEEVSVEIIKRPESLEFIKKKILGKKLSEEEMKVIMKDISEKRLTDVDMAYFMSTFFNPGLDEDEVLYAAKGMADAGDKMNFKGFKDNGDLVVDKHSIGGMAGKGVTPIVVPILASAGLVIPNTSTRAITTPAGTSDILEVVMPVDLSEEEIYDTVKKTGACMVWGGALKLAPADDVLIHIERNLHIQSHQKLLMSIIAKKIAMGVSQILIDIPFGKEMKVKTPEEAEVLSKSFIRLFGQVDIKCETFVRPIFGPDGYGIGPVLEMRDIFRIYERDAQRPLALENIALEMSGRILEMSGKAERGRGKDMAFEILDKGQAAKKFWEIATTQGAEKTLASTDMKPADYTSEVLSGETGVISYISNAEIVKIARALGNPFIKEAGIYLNVKYGDKIKKGEKIMTLYANSATRLETGLEAVNLKNLFEIK